MELPENVYLWTEAVPKVELHLHLEGAIPLPTLYELIRKYGGSSEVPDMQSLYERFTFIDFPHFIETWLWKAQYHREYEDFTLIAEAVAQDLKRQNILYAETFFSPSDYARHGLTPSGLTEAIYKGLQMVEGVEIKLIPDLVRMNHPAKSMGILEEVAEMKDFGVIGVGLGGPEHEFPPEPFATVFSRARELGLHTTAHAGEAAGPSSIWGALQALGAERIGHAARAGNDPKLITYLKEKQIPLEMCPLSNARTGVVSQYHLHPVKQFYESGLLVTINTDDPKMFNNSLAEEYQMLMTQHGFTVQDIQLVITNAVKSAWLDDEDKQILLARVQSHPNWQVENS